MTAMERSVVATNDRSIDSGKRRPLVQKAESEARIPVKMRNAFAMAPRNPDRFYRAANKVSSMSSFDCSVPLVTDPASPEKYSSQTVAKSSYGLV